MYELTCPSCSHVVTSPFIRIGAVVDCEECSHRFRIQETDVNRLVKIPAGQNGQGDTGWLNKPPVRPNRDNFADESAQQVLGLSGLSEIMRQESPRQLAERKAEEQELTPPKQRKHRSKHPEKTPAAGKTAPTPTRQNFKQKRSKSQFRLMIILSCSFAIVLALAAVTGYMVYDSLSNQAQQGAVQSHYDVPMSNMRSPWPTLQRIPAVRLRHEPWQVIGQPYEAYMPEVNESFSTTLVQDGSNPNDHRLLLATVRMQGDQVLMHGRLQLSMVNTEGHELVRTYMPVVALAPNRSQTVCLRLPSELLAQGLKPRLGRVNVSATQPSTHVLHRTNIESAPDDDVYKLKLSAYNDQERPLSQIVFVVYALNANHDPMARWRVTWNGAMESNMWQEVWTAVRLPDNANIARWQVEAIGFEQMVETPDLNLATNDDPPRLPATFFGLNDQGNAATP